MQREEKYNDILELLYYFSSLFFYRKMENQNIEMIKNLLEPSKSISKNERLPNVINSKGKLKLVLIFGYDDNKIKSNIRKNSVVKDIFYYSTMNSNLAYCDYVKLIKKIHKDDNSIIIFCKNEAVLNLCNTHLNRDQIYFIDKIRGLYSLTNIGELRMNMNILKAYLDGRLEAMW